MEKHIMAGTKKTPTRAVYKQFLEAFYQVVSDLRTQKEVKIFSLDFFTDSEREMFAKRLAIAHFLTEGKSYDEIRKTLKVSSATISSVADSLSSKGMSLALEKIQIEAWAEKWAKRVMGWMGR